MAYSPATNLTTTGTLQHLAAVYYNRKALDQLMVMFRFLLGTEPDVLPLRSGKTMQWYRYSLFTANTTPASEGTVGTGISLSSTTVSGTVSEYADFLTISTLLQDTTIDPIVTNASDNLGYRAGLSTDTIVRTEFDSTSTPRIGTLGASLSSADFRRAVALLTGANVLPKMGDDFVGIIHPYVAYDLKSDNTAGGFIDVMKYANPSSLLSNEIGRVESVRLFRTTNVSTDGTAAPGTKYRTYVIGKGAVGAVDLAGSGPTKVEDPTKQSFRIMVSKGGPSVFDPEGMIASAVAYRFVFLAKILDSTVLRFKVIEADASIV